MVVHGAGPAGSATAIHLARAGARVVLYDRGVVGPGIGESLPGAAAPLLAELGLGTPPGVASAGTLSAWGTDGLAIADPLVFPYGGGWSLDRPAFDAWLRARAVEVGVELRQDEPPTAGWRIDATGRKAALARSLGARRRYTDKLFAFHQRFSPERTGDEPRLLVETVPDGWWYSARLPSGDRVVLFLTDRDLAPTGRSWFLHRMLETRWLSATLAHWRYLPSGPFRGADARSGITEPVCGPGWAAVGDAAFTADPLTSQGIADALLGARAVADLVLGRTSGEAYAAKVRAMWEGLGRGVREAYARERRHDGEFWRRRRG